MSSSKMKAIFYRRKDNHLPFQIAYTDIPEPLGKEVLVQVNASTMNTGDLVRIKIGMLPKRTPITGSEFSGKVVKTGPFVKNFKVGDDVFGYIKTGAHAEFLVVPENGVIASKPVNMDHEQAASLPNGLLSALYFIRKSGLDNDHKILVYGASGSVGCYAVQLARSVGAEVHAVCSARNTDLVKGLGASKVIDYTREDVFKSGEKYDVIFDAVNKTSFGNAEKALRTNGKFVTVGLNGRILMQVMFSFLRKKKVLTGIASHKGKDLAFMGMLVAEGVIRPVIDRTYVLEELSNAYDYVSKGTKSGNVVIQTN